MPEDSADDSRQAAQHDAQADEQRDALQRAVSCYLSTVLTMAKCVGAACPEVGGLYRHRLARLRARLAFDASPEAIEESCAVIEAVLDEFGAKASFYVAQHGIELRAAIATLDEIVRSLARREDFYAARLRQFASQMGAARYAAEPGQLQEVIELEAAGLLSCVESMGHEMQSMVTGMRNELRAVERRIQESEVTDPLTGLMNRREMERQIEARKNTGTAPVLVHFELTGEVNAEVMQQASARLGSQFRHNDFVSRWSDTEFMVLFQGPREIAQMRAEQIVPWVAGRYLLDNGENVQIGIEARLEQPELAA